MSADNNQNQGFAIQSVGSVPPVKSIDAIFLYDPKDGRVVHIHHAIVFGDMRRTDREFQQGAALDAARALGQSVDRLRALHVPDFKPTSGRYRVDIKKNTLIEEPASRLKRPKSTKKRAPRDKDAAKARFGPKRRKRK